MKRRVLTFFSAQVSRAADGSVLIALFNGGKDRVMMLRCSADAALSLISNVADVLRSDNESQGKNGE